MKRLLLFLLAVSATLSLSAQSVQSLRDQIRRAEDDIRINTKLLEKNRKDQKVTLEQLKLIRARIGSRRKMLTSLEAQIALIGKEVEGKTKDISQLDNQLEKLRTEYSKMVYEGYKNYKTNNFTLFIIAADDFNDAAKRLAYVRRYSAACQQKASQIDTLAHNLTLQVEELNVQQEELALTKSQHAGELAALGKDEKTYKTSAETLRKSESKLSSAVKARQAQIAKAQNEIQKIIAAEAKKSAATPKTAAESKADAVITGKFDQNMGRLPYPVTGGTIIDQYGIHEHPTQKGLKVNNKGINIATPQGAEVRCVFEGVVTNVFFFQGLNNNVMVRHGSYITVYSNLASVAVKKGDKVALNQKIGTVSAGDNDADHMLHFEIWKETTNLNPGLWLRR